MKFCSFNIIHFKRRSFRSGAILSLSLLLCLTGVASAAEQPDLNSDLKSSLQELARVREAIGKEKLPMVKGLNSLEDTLMDVRLEHQKVSRQLDSRNLDLNNLRSEIKTRQGEKSYISNLLGEYGRNFETRLHITELNQYRDVIDTANLAPDNSNLTDTEVYLKQIDLVEASIIRLKNLVGGASFVGTAAGEDGLVKEGMVSLIGPVGLYLSDDGALAGIAEQRLGSLEPSVIPLSDSAMEQMVREMVKNGQGVFPFDPSLGNARKMEETNETLLEHIGKGGHVMYPILIMFGFAMLIALLKAIQLWSVAMPSDSALAPILRALGDKDFSVVKQKVDAVKGPTQAMLKAGVDHIGEPKDLIEEVMFEEMLTTRLKLQKWTSFISVCAASAPLLGLLGTVTGIINTFKLITVFGSGDVKTLSGGISEALITTEFGLIVAIPSLVFYALLSRKAKSITDRMEQVAILFMNRLQREAVEG